MGLPQQPTEHAQSHPDSTTSPQPQPGKPQLPPEALDLASKIFDFAREGKVAELRQYLTAGIPPNLTNHKGDTLIMLAAYHGHLEAVEMLLEKGADMDVLNGRGQSPIAGAVFKGYDEIVKAMAERGADLAAGQPNAIEAARMFHRTEMLRLFRVDEEAS
ncbi:Putative ankyrin repeat protein [Fulvia fulva]|uniref:Ankyrin repeat protein n=1 Tax=Passalora fulva TaxID=5499 RepID=A0A9Q8P9Y6_PASFU|nr:Putative ankyrin repeat protein [Fulvia fulva]KAK4623411.1 putative ankyrin repeat protein [Fulvia fulva]UJO18614.1 Putative ankyrin repeat protein [Fulvia fulva]WPV31033.1 Putative ankyrin repeat protein [Fulvia fulva]